MKPIYSATMLESLAAKKVCCKCICMKICLSEVKQQCESSRANTHWKIEEEDGDEEKKKKKWKLQIVKLHGLYFNVLLSGDFLSRCKEITLILDTWNQFVDVKIQNETNDTNNNWNEWYTKKKTTSLIKVHSILNQKRSESFKIGCRHGFIISYITHAQLSCAHHS